MKAKIKITGLSEAEKTAREIIEHVEEIKRLMSGASWNSVIVDVDLDNNDETASGN